MAGLPVPTPSREKILCIADLERAASGRMSTTAREFFNSGSTEQITIHENSLAYNKYRVRPRVLVNVANADPSTTVFGQRIPFPLCVSPVGIQALAHPDGELATSRACARKGTHMGISSFANNSIAAIRSAGLAVGPLAHAVQLYTMKDRALQLRIIREAERRGCRAILLTADSPVLGVRYNEWRNDFRTPAGLAYPVMERSTEVIRSTTHDQGFTSFNDDSHSWAREIPWLRSVTSMQIWIKGVLTAEDTRVAVDTGCDGVLVSNHGGRQLDGVPAAIDALPECVEVAKGRIGIHVDGGIRSGTDIFKALALGAECCWVGRPAVWGLAYDGEEGVGLMLDTFHDEFKRCMQLAGCNSIQDITKSSLGVVRADGPLARL